LRQKKNAIPPNASIATGTPTPAPTAAPFTLLPPEEAGVVVAAGFEVVADAVDVEVLLLLLVVEEDEDEVVDS